MVTRMSSPSLLRFRSVAVRSLALAALCCLVSIAVTSVDAAPPKQDDMYCGMANCYDVLGVPNTATQGEIKKAFYKLSLTLHPDKNPDPSIVERYTAITTAYEVVGDPEARAGYEEALSHPERFWRNQMRYMKFKYKFAPQVDAWKILLIALIGASLLHYYYWRYRFLRAPALIASHPKVIMLMRAKVKTDILQQKASQGQKNPLASKSEIDAGVLKEDVRQYAELASWEGRAPTLWDTLPVWLALLPWRLAKILFWYARWFVLFTILRRPYGEEEAGYATSVALGTAYHKWLVVPAEERAELVARELWLPKNFEAWQKEKAIKKKKTW